METTKITLIDAPASLVFKILLDVDLATAWVPKLTHFEIISKSNNMVGSTYRSRFDFDGYKFEQVSGIKVYVENQSVEWVAISKFCDGEVKYLLTPISETRTEFKHFSQCEYKGLTRIFAWLVKSRFKKISEDYIKETHEKFKALVEAEYASGTNGEHVK